MIGIYNDSSSTTFSVYTYGEMLVEPYSTGDYYIRWVPTNATGSVVIGGTITSQGYWTGSTVTSITSMGGRKNLPYSSYLFRFSNCNITAVEGNLTYGVYNMFFQCSYLVTADLYNMTHLGFGAFESCTRLQHVNLPLVDGIEDGTFFNCTSLKDISLPNCEFLNVNAFQSCGSLSYAYLPKCEYVGKQAFTMCYNLESVILGSCSYIGSDAFYRCSKLKLVYMNGSSVAQLFGTYTFSNTLIASGYGSIYVPSSLVSAYRAATRWSSISYMIRSIPSTFTP